MADLNTLVAAMTEKKTTRDHAKIRYDSAESVLHTHGTDNHEHFERSVREAYQMFEEAHNDYLSACRALLNAVHDQMYAAQEEFEPACSIYGEPNYENS